MFKKLQKDEYFVTFSHQHKHLHREVQDRIVGGPSIVLTRHHERGKTRIRGGSEICKKVIGYDANSLYLWCIGANKMPVGWYTLREKENG